MRCESALQIDHHHFYRAKQTGTATATRGTRKTNLSTFQVYLQIWLFFTFSNLFRFRRCSSQLYESIQVVSIGQPMMIVWGWRSCQWGSWQCWMRKRSAGIFSVFMHVPILLFPPLKDRRSCRYFTSTEVSPTQRHVYRWEQVRPRESEQFQISPAAPPEILHRTVWRTWLFIAYSDERWLCYQIVTTSLIRFSLKGWDNVHLAQAKGRLTLSLLRMINVKFPLKPQQKYYITRHGELGFS